ncbi:integrator complex subunit 14 [Strongylocentrotus purpuratus]|uniref:Integrator complex subunit 14 n=1 Tax=Strongylocentrotus purpuratus TaxID=7668 RepID=A0A7M7NBA1_STRPU|nr:integrator complex subunit 14 [Strongylocentrotus purpuratus]
MPTLVILDASLSMMRPLATSSATLDPATTETRRSVAQTCLCSMFDYIAANDRMEFGALVAYSSLYEVLVPFTRDLNELKKAVQSMDTYDKTLLDSVLLNMSNYVMEEWGSNTPVRVVLVTDGNPGIGPGSVKHILSEMSHQTDQSKNPLPFVFPSELHILLISSQSELAQSNALNLYQRLVDANENGQVHTPGEGALTVKSVQNMFMKYAESQHSVFSTTLHCGNLSSDVQLFPRPKVMTVEKDTEVMTREVGSDLQVCGFLDMGDAVSPPSVSRHLVIPYISKEKSETSPDAKDSDKPEEDASSSTTTEEGKTPSFCVLLHGSLKINGMVALVQITDDWYGILYSWADSKKKSNMMLSIFEPGSKAIPWLGKFTLLGPCSAFDQNPYGEDDNKTPFPVMPDAKRSYAQNPVVWIKNSNLQSDVQKILRYARKLPDKTQVFYKELNRLRRAALSFGMQDFLEGISQLLERECTLLPGSAHVDAALQLTHAAKLVKNSVYKEYDYTIAPLSTNFTGNT